MKNKVIPWILLFFQLLAIVLMFLFMERRDADPKWQQEESTGIVGLEAPKNL